MQHFSRGIHKMAVLSDNDRAAISKAWQELFSSRRDIFGAVTKNDIRAAINAIDTWVDDNVASYNSAIPLPARTELTAKQKAELLVFVVRRRWEIA
jgi:hypothetical protein